jgi:hypothetical protein
MSKKSVEEQKGPIKAHEESYRTMTHTQKVRERASEMEMIRHSQTMDLHEPKQ